MFKQLFLCMIACVGLLSSPADAKPLNMRQILDATCRVSATGSMGSGTCFDYKNGKYYILTNAHVVGNANSGQVEFFKYGRKTQLIPATVVWKQRSERTAVDFAILTVDEKYFGDAPPQVIPLIEPNHPAKAGDYIASAGCPRGTWAKAWEGMVVKPEGDRIIFHPPPVGGQSGSGLLTVVKIGDNYETRIIGVVTWRIGPTTVRRDNSGYEQAKGGAVTIDTMRKVQNGTVSEFERIPDNYIEVAQALGTDGKLYPIIYYTDGSREVVLPPNVGIFDWNPSPNCPPGGGGGGGDGGGCPPQPYKGGDYWRPAPGESQPPEYSIPAPKAPSPAPPKAPSPAPKAPNVPTPAPPKTEPNQPKGNSPYGQLPDWAGDDEVKALKQKLDEAKKLEEELNKAIKTYESEIDNLTTSMLKLQEEQKQLLEKTSGQIATLESKLQAEQTLSSSLKTELQQEVEKVTAGLAKVKELGDQIQALENNVAKKDNKLNDIQTELSDSQQDLEAAQEEGQRKVEPATFFGVTSGAAIIPMVVWVLWYLWKKRGGRQKIQKAMDAVEDRLQKRVEPILGEDLAQQLREALDGLEKRVGDKVEKKLGSMQTGSTFEDAIKDLKSNVLNKIDDALNNLPVNEPKQVAPSVVPLAPTPPSSSAPIETKEDDTAEKVLLLLKQFESRMTDSLEKRLTEKIPNQVTTVIHNYPDESAPIESEDLVPERLPTTPQGLNYAKELFALKEKEGESVKHWAVFAQLYREAVSQLRKGVLYLDGTTKLQGQARTADAIDNWVRKEFLKSLTINDVKDKDELYRDALIGVLYRDAVDCLRSGKFDILGADTTARAIQTWVEKEFLRRMGIKL